MGGGEVGASAPMRYADGTVALPGEQLAFVFAVAKSGTSLPTDSVPFVIAADGSLVATNDNVEILTWGSVTTANSGIHSVTIGNDGYPDVLWQPLGDGNGSYTTIPVYWPTAAGTRPMRYAYFYSVLLDTRTFDPATGAVTVAGEPFSSDYAPTPVSAYGTAYCYRFGASPMGLTHLWMDLPETLEPPSGADASVAVATRLPELPNTLVVGDETLTDSAAIEAALAPTVSGIAATQDEEGGPAFTFTFSPAQVPGLTTYTLWTSDRLDGGWEPFETFASEKGLALPDGLRYTKWRIQEGVSAVIPRLPDEDTRFYRLRGDINVGTNESVKGE